MADLSLPSRPLTVYSGEATPVYLSRFSIKPFGYTSAGTALSGRQVARFLPQVCSLPVRNSDVGGFGRY